MRIIKAKRAGRPNGSLTCILGRDETKRWEDGGPEGWGYRRALRERLIDRLPVGSSATVEIYAAARAGGWLADQLTARI